MPDLFVFLLKVNVALLAFCAGYYLVLRHLTFYTLNRIYLVGAILFASIYPKINISGFLQQHQQIAEPVQTAIINFQLPDKAFTITPAQSNYWQWVEVVFWIGAVLFTIRLLIQLFSLLKIYRNSTASQIFGHEVRLIKDKTGPFSFWKSIYVNPENYEPADLKAILLHEQVHINEWHTIDILLAELSTIFYWFNPGIWLMKKAIRENIEFITDNKIIKNGTDSKQYQYSLVSVSFASSSNTIVNHFNISTIKKRIIMMNSRKSSPINLTRYAFLIPVVVALLLVFGISKAALIKKRPVVDKVRSIAINPVTAPNIKHQIAIGKTNPGSRIKLPVIIAADTVRKDKLFISLPSKADSLNYIINGVKANKVDFDALESKRIYSIELMPAEKAKKLYDNIDNQNDVLFVTTSDSESGKKFKNKIDKLNGISHNGRNITITKSTSAGRYSSTESIGNLSLEKRNSATIVSTESDDSSDGTNIGIHPKVYALTIKPSVAYRISSDTLILSKGGKPYVLSFKVSDSLKVNTAYAINPKFKTSSLKAKTFAYKAHGYTLPKAYTIEPDNNEEANIEHLSAKLIMIDGKEANEHDLKKLSAGDIESMSVKSGEEMTEKYGNKAKNGVLFITTKK